MSIVLRKVVGFEAIFSYSAKRVVRSWKLFLALLVGIILASAFFSGIGIGADSMARNALNQALSQTQVDIDLNYNGIPTSNNLTVGLSTVSTVEGVSSAEINCVQSVETRIPSTNETLGLMFADLFDGSKAYEGISGWTGTLGINETIVSTLPSYANKLHVGDIVAFNLTQGYYIDGEYSSGGFPVRLTIVGFVTLTDDAYTLLTQSGYYIGPYTTPSPSGVPQFSAGPTYDIQQSNICLVNWATISKLLDSTTTNSYPSNGFRTKISVFLDRESILDPWDVAKSLDVVGRIAAIVGNKLGPLSFGTYDRLSETLRSYQYVANNMRFGTIITSLPIFFVAWYMASTVSNVSFNLRRREIGLLLSKGSTKWQLQRIFLSEAFLIGVIGGVIGVALSLPLSPLFVQFSGGLFGNQVVLGPGTILTTIVFGVIIALASIFQSARKASKLDPVNAMKEYEYLEEAKPYKRLLPMAALSLGTFKVTTLFLGVNFQSLAMNFGGTNIFVSIILFVLMFLDGLLNYIGPLLFFWGVTKVFVQGSVIFQKLSARLAGSYLKDLGSLATRNVQRNPGRTAAIAFLIALIVGYTISVNGALASEQDYTRREIFYNVGTYDLSVALPNGNAVAGSVSKIENISGISSTTVEYNFYGDSTLGSLYIRAVDPVAWSSLAYYEEDWFTGQSSSNAFQALSQDNQSIILDKYLARFLRLDIGDSVALSFGNVQTDLRVVGLFGSDQLQQAYYYTYSRSYPSFVSQGLYRTIAAGVSATPRILVKLETGADRVGCVQVIRNLDPSIGSVLFADEVFASQQSRADLVGVANIQRLGIAFAVVAASVGTGLVTVVSLSERKKEISLISVRGASYRQLVLTLLSETFSVIIFALLLGTFVGFVMLRGNMVATNISGYSLVQRRIVFPTEFLSMLSSGYILVFASLMIPVFMVSRKYMSNLGDALRQR